MLFLCQLHQLYEVENGGAFDLPDNDDNRDLAG